MVRKLWVCAFVVACSADFEPPIDDDSKMVGGGVLPHFTSRSEVAQKIASTTVNGMITTIAIDPYGTLYAGGYFHSLEGDDDMSYIAALDAAGWYPLGSGLDAAPEDIAVDPSTGEVYVAGSFSDAGGVAVSNVAKWSPEDGEWSQLGSGLSGWVHVLEIDADGNLYAGGYFSGSGGDPLI